jgi:hypothetical protein
MNNIQNIAWKVLVRTIVLLAASGLPVLSGCSPERPNGIYLIINLENQENIKQYSVFNPYDHSVEVCKSTAEAAIAQLLASNPPVIPRDSRIKSWRCSLTPPGVGQ